MAALGAPLLENDYAALVRVLTERVVAAANILEDGCVDSKKGPPTYANAAGEKVPVRNLVDEAVKATLDAARARRRPRRRWRSSSATPPTDFTGLRVAVKLPPPPEYYSPDMDLSVVIDRGDVFYDPLFDEKGKADAADAPALPDR